MLYIPYPSWLSPEIIPNLPFRWYGLMYLFAFATTYVLFQWQIRKRKLTVPPDLVMNLFFWAIVGLLLGARIFSTLIYDTTGRYLREPWLIFWPFGDNGQFTGFQGMSYHGGVIGAVLAIVIYCRAKKIDTLDWGDMMVQAIPLGYTFGRLGNFINGELYGKVTDSPIGMLFPDAQGLPTNLPWVTEIAAKVGISIPEGAQFINLPRYPSQLFEAFFEGIVLWLILWFISRPHKPFKGFSIGLYMIGYGFFRFIIEYFREPDRDLGFRIILGPKDNPPELFMSLLNFSTGQILNFLMIAAGVAVWLVCWQLDSHRLRVESFDTTRPKKAKPESEWDAPGPNPGQAEAEQRRKQRRKTRKKLQ
jgi:phosphatidylglycerol:prolipoprotein diacylglycerol transferase